jgi:golgin subfamily B member 1
VAARRSEQSAIEFFVAKAIQYAEIASKEETEHLRIAAENAPYVLSTLIDDIASDQKSTRVFPFREIYNKHYIEPRVVPKKPILISRSSTSVTLKMPGFHPKVSDYELEQDPSIGILKNMALYGRVSSGSNPKPCSLDDVSLDKTGIRVSVDSVNTVKGLQMNERYSFAVAAYSLKEGVESPINDDIGNTSEAFGIYHPLPINMLYGYIAKIAYQIQDYQAARKAAKKCCNYFMEKTSVPELYLAN